MTNKFVDHTRWIPVDEAKAIIAKFIADGVYTKEQIKKSSNLFANRKDKTDGYVARVLVLQGIHPELEIAKEPKKNKVEKVKKVKEEKQGDEYNPYSDRRQIVDAESLGGDSNSALFLFCQKGVNWIEYQKDKPNDRIIIKDNLPSEPKTKLIFDQLVKEYRQAIENEEQLPHLTRVL